MSYLAYFIAFSRLWELYTILYIFSSSEFSINTNLIMFFLFQKPDTHLFIHRFSTALRLRSILNDIKPEDKEEIEVWLSV